MQEVIINNVNNNQNCLKIGNIKRKPLEALLVAVYTDTIKRIVHIPC